MDEKELKTLAFMRNITEEYLIKRIKKEEVLLGNQHPTTRLLKEVQERVNNLYKKEKERCKKN